MLSEKLTNYLGNYRNSRIYVKTTTSTFEQKVETNKLLNNLWGMTKIKQHKV